MDESKCIVLGKQGVVIQNAVGAEGGDFSYQHFYDCVGDKWNRSLIKRVSKMKPDSENSYNVKAEKTLIRLRAKLEAKKKAHD